MVNDAQNDPEFSERGGDVPIAHMVCAPIVFGESTSPFGVASFHNANVDRRFSDDDVTLVKAYTETLGMMLEISELNLESERSKRVFIVHGRDRESFLELRSMLIELKVDPVVMQEQPKAGQEALQMVERLIHGCRGGFVLMTPDDVGRLKVPGKGPLLPRARENVIFEAGILTSIFRATNKVCFVVKKPLELPSDMKGLLYEEFEAELNQKRIEAILRSWGMVE